MEAERMRVTIDAVVPADDVVSASGASGLRFLARFPEHDRPEWTDRMTGTTTTGWSAAA